MDIADPAPAGGRQQAHHEEVQAEAGHAGRDEGLRSRHRTGATR